MKILALSWAPFGHRMDELSEAVGGDRVSITFLYGPRYFAPLRYVVLFLRTSILLLTRGPDVVYAQNPPVFCPLSSLLYCRAARKRLVIDHHSIWRVKTIGGLVGKVIGFMEAFVSASATLNTAPHAVWAAELRAMGASKVAVVHDFVERNPFEKSQAARLRYSTAPLLAIASHGGHPLERVEAELGAVAKVKGLALLITGPPSKLSHRLENLPPNVKYLGLLPMDDYLRLKASCDFALNITEEPHTLSHVLFEYVASSLPVVSSRQQVVEDTFGDSLIYAEDSSQGKVSETLAGLANDPRLLEEYRERTASLYVSLQKRHDAEIATLRNLMC